MLVSCENGSNLRVWLTWNILSNNPPSTNVKQFIFEKHRILLKFCIYNSIGLKCLTL